MAASNADVIVLGAGAAGMFCAFEAGRRGRRVLLLDHGDRPGRKILISGGGRCNFTNTGTRPENFLSDNPHFARSALARYTPADFIALVQQHDIRYHEKTLGQLFCDDSARRIVTLLERECGAAGVDLRCGIRILRVDPISDANPATEPPRFRLETSAGPFTCRTLVVATGGLSIPKLGATGFGYDLARQFGHTVIDPRPALVPLTLAPDDLADWSDLSGVSAEVIAQALPPPSTSGPNRPSKVHLKPVKPQKEPPNPAFRERFLITHRGLSGPAVLQISSFWHPGTPVQFDLAPGQDLLAAIKSRSSGRDRNAVLTALKSVVSARLAERWLDLYLPLKPDWTNRGLDRLETALHHWRLHPAGTEGFNKAEVTAGGINTRDLDARTMESLKIPGLHFIGEVVDVTGWLGGYNFQWAWASAAVCGRNL